MPRTPRKRALVLNRHVATFAATAVGVAACSFPVIYWSFAGVQWMSEHDSSLDPLPVSFGVLAFWLLLASTCSLILRRRGAWLMGVPLSRLMYVWHPLLGVLAVCAALIHSAGLFSLSKSGTYLTVAVVAEIAVALLGRAVERRRLHLGWLPVGKQVARAWRTVHSVLGVLVLGLLIWHLIAVVPLLLP